ncbi:MAG TPA: tetratricopeptide repeat protein [Polyangium sp.]|nr:tetratricopeptide repeat protein [Polyangium sp.]
MNHRFRFALGVFAIALFQGVVAACTESTTQTNTQVPPQPTAPFGGAGANPFTQPMGPMAQPGAQPMTDPNAPPAGAPGQSPAAPPMPEAPTLTPNGMMAMQQGTGAYVQGNLEQARLFYKQATLSDPTSAHAFHALAVVEERLRDLNAEASYQRAIALAPKFEPAIIAYAHLLIRRNKYSDAERFLTEKRAALGRNAAITATLAEVKSLQKDTGSAQRLAQEALKINPDYRPAMVIIARDHYRNRRLDLALYALTAILDGFGDENPPRDKDNPEAFLLRGLILREQGQRAAAMDQFRKVVQRRPDFVEARAQLATMLLEAGNAQEALMLLEGAVKFDQYSTPIHLGLGDTYRLLGRYTDAKREFEWVVMREPALPQIHYNLGLLYLFAPSIPGMTPKEQVAEAIKELKRFQEVRRKSDRDDSDELIQRAKLKEGELAATAQAEQPAPLPAMQDGGVGEAGVGTPPGMPPGMPSMDDGGVMDGGFAGPAMPPPGTPPGFPPGPVQPPPGSPPTNPPPPNPDPSAQPPSAPPPGPAPSPAPPPGPAPAPAPTSTSTAPF